MDKILSIFVDESGDFGDFNIHSPNYLVTFVMHDQRKNIDSQLAHFDTDLISLGYNNHSIHAGPLIRKEEVYINISVAERKKILKTGIDFIKCTDLSYKTFIIEKKYHQTQMSFFSKLAESINLFIHSNRDYFENFDKVIIYYDNGQIELKNILKASFSTLHNYEMKTIKTWQYRLFQAADIITTIELAGHKIETKTYSNSEKVILGDPRDFKKGYLKLIRKKLFE
ncbi:MAG: hypothetical protein R3Y32_04545 [Bacillota bacterium]